YRAENLHQHRRWYYKDDYRKIVRLFREEEVPHHTFPLPSERNIHAVVRGVPVNFSDTEIKGELEQRGYSPLHIIRLKRSGGAPMPLVVVILPKTEKSQQVFNEHELLGLAIRVEVQKNSRLIGQCHRCQKGSSDLARFLNKAEGFLRHFANTAFATQAFVQTQIKDDAANLLYIHNPQNWSELKEILTRHYKDTRSEENTYHMYAILSRNYYSLEFFGFRKFNFTTLYLGRDRETTSSNKKDGGSVLIAIKKT
ncbi:unnamed protein product, partial [Acanthoscelides obtectus]